MTLDATITEVALADLTEEAAADLWMGVVGEVPAMMADPGEMVSVLVATSALPATMPAGQSVPEIVRHASLERSPKNRGPAEFGGTATRAPPCGPGEVPPGMQRTESGRQNL